jgi:hypothetical protein
MKLGGRRQEQRGVFVGFQIKKDLLVGERLWKELTTQK